ncbi:molybdopterin cofactor-binding domain-containing protein [Mesorhizobium caraganae]|uniref:molybdopterin cofactor-binding domain-containing protein n=1 Tax=Mesorhizobium caraganae TaxID=483206 RepID=UPI00333B9F3F
MGCATAIYPTSSAPCAARVRLTADGQVRIQCGSHEIGTGVRTVAGQMAAGRLGLDIGKVSVEMGDSALPPAPVSGRLLPWLVRSTMPPASGIDQLIT